MNLDGLLAKIPRPERSGVLSILLCLSAILGAVTTGDTMSLKCLVGLCNEPVEKTAEVARRAVWLTYRRTSGEEVGRDQCVLAAGEIEISVKWRGYQIYCDCQKDVTHGWITSGKYRSFQLSTQPFKNDDSLRLIGPATFILGSEIPYIIWCAIPDGHGNVVVDVSP